METPAVVTLRKWLSDWLEGKPPKNVWIGTTVENQEYADKRIPELLKIPARVRFLSVEPLLGEIELDPLWIGWRRVGWDHKANKALIAHRSFVDRLNVTGITRAQVDWVIVGGESGPKARTMLPSWARDLRDQCAAAGLPFFFKQWGGVRSGGARLLDDVEYSQFPEVA